MGNLPDAEKNLQDLIDYLSEGSKEIVDIPQPDGTVKTETRMKHEKIYWETRLVNSPTFARYVLILKLFEGLILTAKHNMSKARAEAFGKEVMIIVEAHKSHVDAKSSETLRNKDNTQPSLVDKLQKITIQKSISLRGDKEKGILASFGSSTADEEARN